VSITRRTLEDPDTGERATETKFDLRQPFNPSQLDELERFLNAKSTPGRLEASRLKLADLERIDGYANIPEYGRALAALIRCATFCHRKEWAKADGELLDFAAQYERAMRRAAERKVNKIAAGRRSGGLKVGAKRSAGIAERNEQVRKLYTELVASGRDPARAIGVCATKFKLDRSTIRKIVEPRKKTRAS
jgi:hypothetical protein